MADVLNADADDRRLSDAMMDAWTRFALPGSYLFSTGPSYKRKTRGHIDMPLMGCTVMLDGRTIIKDGKIIDPEMKA